MTILRLRHIIPRHGCQAGFPDGRYVIAVAEPPPINRFKGAWAVLTGKAYPVAWPKNGEFEQAMVMNGHELPH